MNKKERTIQALKQLGIQPSQVFNLYGAQTKYLRQNLVWAITGEKQPIAKCGYLRVRELLYGVFGIDPSACGCTAHAEKLLEEAIASALPV